MNRPTMGAAGVLATFLLIWPALGQNASNGVASNGFAPPVNGVGPKPVVREPAPPALPGAQSASPAPTGPAATDIPPTDALFDAINRGDSGGAKEALNRGADVSARNVLGMTPLDLSVDLGRNDITFMLLSLRSQTAVGRAPAQKGLAATVTATRPAKTRVTSRALNAKPARGVSGPVIRYASVPSPAVPQSGFLGFGRSATP